MKFSAGRKDESVESEGPLLCETLAHYVARSVV